MVATSATITAPPRPWIPAMTQTPAGALPSFIRPRRSGSARATARTLFAGRETAAVSRGPARPDSAARSPAERRRQARRRPRQPAGVSWPARIKPACSFHQGSGAKSRSWSRKGDSQRSVERFHLGCVASVEHHSWWDRGAPSPDPDATCPMASADSCGFSDRHRASRSRSRCWFHVGSHGGSSPGGCG